MSKRRPYMPFYYNDWRGEIQLMLCSLSAQAVWLHICGIVWNTEGVLEISENELIELIKNDISDAREIRKALQELEQRKIFSRDPQGRIYSRRIVEEYETYRLKSEAGQIGGKNSSKNKTDLLEQKEDISAQAEKEKSAQAKEREKKQANSGLAWIGNSKSSSSTEGEGCRGEETPPVATPQPEPTRAELRSRSLSDFEAWWQNTWQGSKADKQTAQKHWLRLNPDGSQTQTLCARTQDYFTRRAAAEASGVWVPEVPQAKTYLNQSRWEDQFETPKPRSKEPIPRPASAPKPEDPLDPNPLPLPDSLTERPDDWAATLAALAQTIDPENFNTWIAPIEYLGQDETTLYISVPSNFNRSWVRRNYADQILDQYYETGLENLNIRVRAPLDDEDEAPRVAEPDCSPALPY